MSDNKNVDIPLDGDQLENTAITVSTSEISSNVGSVRTTKTPQRASSSSDRQLKFERAQKALENAALVSKRIKEHRKATAELLGRPFEDDDTVDTASEMASTMSERTGYSVATDTSTTLSVKEALNIPGISESLANTLKQKELLMERIKQYKEISKRPSLIKSSPVSKKDLVADVKKTMESCELNQLINSVKEKENMLSIMQVKMKAMETTILDLQEKINEKDQIIEAKNMATTLMSDSLSKKDKDSVLLLEDTRQQMIKMQENFITIETEWKEEKQGLLKELQLRDEKIKHFEEANTILENSRFEISVAYSNLSEELELKNKQISKLQEQLETLTQMHTEASSEEQEIKEEEKGSKEISNMEELTKKIELLEQLNCQIRQTNKELENKLSSVIEPKVQTANSPAKKGSPLPSRKGKNVASKMKSPWSNLSSESSSQDIEKKSDKNEAAKLEMLVKSLNKDILDKEYTIAQKNELISELQSLNLKKDAAINELQMEREKSSLDTVDVGISTEIEENLPLDKTVTNPYSAEEYSIHLKELEGKLEAAEQQIEVLNGDIDTANKNMIKVKSNHKLKIKQMQKTIDNFSKISDASAEIVKLNEELHQLTQKVAELEEEKGNLQLHLVDYDSGRLTETEIYKKMIEMETLAETRLKAISVLETQKFDLVQELHVLQQKYLEMEDKLADISQFQNEHVCSEMKSVQLEEQVDELIASKKELELVIANLKLDKDQLNGAIKILQEEKEDILHKLENYIQENIDLTDKFEKLSAEKVSSAESIEIVESLTTQEKLELEEYNKGKISEPLGDEFQVSVQQDIKIDNLLQQNSDLTKKIELFTQERQEVMEKMNKISCENKELLSKIETLNRQCTELKENIDLLINEKCELQNLNDALNQQIGELKRERIDIMTETVEITKPSVIDDPIETTSDLQHDEKSIVEKGGRTKSVKQLTKEILKLKNTIKEREAEIADCQMKILSLEEYQQKQNELMQTNTSFEIKIKMLVDENEQLKDKIDSLEKDKGTEKELLDTKNAHEALLEELQKNHQEYTSTLAIRDFRIGELEKLLLEYEKQILNYSETIQLKDKELTEYINQITKLNDVSQKLKSTIELLEEEKLKDTNAELVKSLNKQITAYQKKLSEYEEKLRFLEDENNQLLALKSSLEGKNNNLDIELKKLQETFVENQAFIEELQAQQKKYAEEVANVKQQAIERDVEIHDIKLQLRKESIENEKLRTNLSQRDKDLEDLVLEHEETIRKFSDEKNKLKEQYDTIELKNKELIEKLKKFAINIKKKSSMYIELENQLSETQKQLETKNEQIEQFLIQVETLPALQEKIKHAEEEINRLQSQKLLIEQQKAQDVTQLLSEMSSLKDKIAVSSEDVLKSNESLNTLHKEIHLTREENSSLKVQLEALQNKLVEYEIEQKNNLNFITKISTLEADIKQKQQQISDLLYKMDNQEQQLNQLQFGHDAKVQERELYIENLETEITKYKNRICRLEESISVMEDRRHSLERKADQLDNQLREKQKAYSEYSSQEDELVARLAVLMDHDRVIEKQLHEIESDNKELQYKIQHTSEENQRLRKALSDIQDYCNTLVEKASRTDSADAEILQYQSQLHDLESNLKRLTHEHQTLLIQRKQDIEDLEMEFNTQIENAIKEKKALSEKYEKINEHVSRLELKLQEYRNNIETLNLNLDEVNKINQDLIQKSASKDEIVSPDYTDQYINEINKLNSLLNHKNQENSELHNKIQSIQNNNVAIISTLESKISDLKTTLHDMSAQTDRLNQELHSVKQCNKQLQDELNHKEEVIKDLKEKKKVTFEMNIPKTEGMVISSTIEALSEEEQPKLDISSLQSQIIADIHPEAENKNTAMKISEYFQSKPSVEDDDSSRKSIESEIVPKKAYLCYKAEDASAVETDPFNSDEGWGLGEAEETGDISSDLSHLNKKILDLKVENEKLKNALDTSNAKLLKALKKMKELKTNNDMLSKELTLSKHISQSSFLDTAIEDELRNNIQELEKKIEELNNDLIQERKDKGAIKKQNEVFSTANERLTDMKEKMDNEVELWKFKFKEVNDKLSSLQWEAKDSPVHKIPVVSSVINDDALKDEITKLEKENEELQQILDHLTAQNKELSIKQSQMINEIDNLHNKLQQSSNCASLNDHILELQRNNEDLSKNNELLSQSLHDLEVRYNELTHNHDQLLSNKEEMQSVFENDLRNLSENCLKLEENVKSLTILESEANNKVEVLTKEVDLFKQKHEELLSTIQLKDADSLMLSEKYGVMETQCTQLKALLEAANNKIYELESVNQELIKKIDNYDELLSKYTQQIKDYEKTIDNVNNKETQELVKSETDPHITDHEELISELNAKLQQLNTENDQLLSTVAELRSSISSAVDQRGFEISELWKQHLAQREADFQKTEQELRSELSASESKYEQLLDSVQSSSQEETNKLVMIEQVTSLQHKLVDKEDHLRNLQDKYAEVMNQLDMLRSEIEDEKIMYDNKLLTQQDEYEKILLELRMKNELNAESNEGRLLSIQAELTQSKTTNELLTQQVEKLTIKITESEKRILDLCNDIQIKDSEIYQKALEYGHTLSQRNEEFENVRKQLVEYEKKLEEITYEKESELAILRLKMHDNNEQHDKIQKELEGDKFSLSEALNEKIVECTNLNKQIIQLNQSLEEHLNRATEMQMALENQEVEIVTLKDEIAELQQAMRISSSKIEKHVTFASGTKPGAENEKLESELNTELLDAVPRAELDLALYMLHQRDVRCEELTMELTQLLEERDTLQLRLSDSLRSNEEFKSRCKDAGLDESLSSSQETVSEMPSFTMEKEQQFVDIHRGQTSRSSSISDPDGDKPKLQAKLSELRSVKHSRDVRLRHESEQRQFDMRLLQRDVANLPPEAIDQLAQAHHTLSRDSQSTSTVLLNWLRGKSTPKVVHM